MHKYLLTIFSILIFGCSNEQKQPVQASNDKTTTQREILPEPDILQRLNNDKYSIDQLRDKKDLDIEIRVTTNSNPIPQVVKNLNWPDSVITTYNIYKNSKNGIILIGEYPLSESGNWYIEYLNYYDSNGQIFAFQNNTITHNSQCSETSITMKQTELFNKDFEIVSIETDTTDTENNKIKLCEDLYDYNYQVTPTLNTYLTKEKLK